MSTIDGLTVEERGRPENGLFACDRDDCNEMKARLTAAEARIRELERAARAVLADHAERLEAYGEENEGQPYRVKVMADLCTALNPPPGDEKKGGE